MRAITGYSFRTNQPFHGVKTYLLFDFTGEGVIAIYREGEDPVYPDTQDVMQWQLPDSTTSEQVHRLLDDKAFRPICEFLQEGVGKNREYLQAMNTFFSTIGKHIPGFDAAQRVEILGGTF